MAAKLMTGEGNNKGPLYAAIPRAGYLNSGHISTDHQAKPQIIAPQSRRDQKRGPSQVLLSVELNPDSESKLIHVHEEP
ncbi:MAG TPA: hypothetical protein VGF65_05860, partial [Mycobacterium sp.]